MFTLSGALKGVGISSYLAIQSYLAEGGVSSGWVGGVAKALGVENDTSVDQQKFRNLLRGYTPDGKTALVQNAGKENRQAGWDSAFSCPKSVSVLYAQASPALKKKILHELLEAMRSIAAIIESEFMYSRRGHGGTVAEAVKMLAAIHIHICSRALEPQLHGHMTFLNLGLRKDETFGTIISKILYENQLSIGALFRLELATRLEVNLGIPIERVDDSFEVKGVPRDLCKAFSSRQREIEEQLEKRGLSGQEAKALAWDDTRAPKQNIPNEELLKRWDKVCAEHGFGPEQVAAILKNVPEHRLEESPVSEARAISTSTPMTGEDGIDAAHGKSPNRPETNGAATVEPKRARESLTDEQRQSLADRFWKLQTAEDRIALEAEALGKANPIEKGILERQGIGAEVIKDSLLRRFALQRLSEHPDISERLVDPLQKPIEPAWKKAEEKPGDDLLRYPSLKQMARQATYQPDPDEFTSDASRSAAFEAALALTQKAYKLSWRELEALRPIEHLQDAAKGFEQKSPFENPEAWERAQKKAEEYFRSANDPRNAHLFEPGGAAEYLRQLLNTSDEKESYKFKAKDYYTYRKPADAGPDDVEPPYSRASFSKMMNEALANLFASIKPGVIVRLPFAMAFLATRAIGTGFFAADICAGIRRIAPESLCGIPVHEKRVFPNAPRWSPFHEVILPQLMIPLDRLPRLPVPLHVPKPHCVGSLEIPGFRFEELRTVPEVFGHPVSSLAMESFKVKGVLHKQIAREAEKLANKLADAVEAKRAEKKEAAREKAKSKEEDMSEKLKQKMRAGQQEKPPEPEPHKQRVRI